MTTNPLPGEEKRRRGRPSKKPEDRARNYRSPLTLAGPIPHWIGYGDLKALIKQYRSRMYDERKFALWVEQGIVPSYREKGFRTAVAGVRRRKYVWEEVRLWIDSQMQPEGTLFNGKSTPIQPRG